MQPLRENSERKGMGKKKGGEREVCGVWQLYLTPD